MNAETFEKALNIVCETFSSEFFIRNIAVSIYFWIDPLEIPVINVTLKNCPIWTKPLLDALLEAAAKADRSVYISGKTATFH